RVPDDDQSGRGDRPDCLIWYILRVAIHLRLLGKERREVVRVGRESEVLVVAGGFVHCSPSAPDNWHLLQVVSRGSFTLNGFRTRDVQHLCFPQHATTPQVKPADAQAGPVASSAFCEPTA